MTKPRNWLVVPAAGIGQRMNSDCPKQYLRIHDRFIVDIVLSRLLGGVPFDGCMVALHREDRWWPTTTSHRDPRVQVCDGAAERHLSVLAALRALAAQASDEDWVLVHDVARPCIACEDVRKLMTTLESDPVGGLLATPVTDTLKRAGMDGDGVSETVDRSRLWRALTPQMFRFGALKAAIESVVRGGVSITDDASAMEYTGAMPRLVEGRSDNIKITVPSDLTLAGFLLGRLPDEQAS
ncbi:2-C-methyl-D-erythritol 4-phosphate cytidylyltransferase [Marinobacter changyiensis]|uniref:2-C-methyl-D-erythritol 4-phosphate cytidylyltransferase n=1 Tax=Marinobacter changyiensis TaxID=2604091 RepID=UPI001265AA5A|nr:2-C-methyl-D-erythritol 4-phosphate cytidylyltransferase [Marinobacter changyiensis]